MAKNLKVELELSAKDNASQAIAKAASDAEKSFKQVTQAAEQAGNAQAQAMGKGATAAQASQKRIEQSYRAARKSAADVARVRETLGVRSENAIQAEIRQTQRAYEQLKRSGVASQNELRRASEQTRQRVKDLNAELGRSSFGDKAAGFGRGLRNVGMGIAAGAAVTAPKMMNAANYDLELARVAETGYSGKSIEEKTKGKEYIHNAIKASLQHGGTKEEALSAIQEMMSKGKVSVDDALALLPTIQKNATATGASSEELTQMVNSMLDFGLSKEQIQLGLDYMNASGKAGGFELKDMAQYFPQLLASAKGNGLSGLEDLKKIGVDLQKVYNVSGGASETATNLNNYYAKLKAGSTAKNLENLEIKDPKTGKVVGVDMKKSMTHYMNQGQNASEAMLSIIGDVLKSDKEYQALLSQVNNSTGSEKKAAMQRIAQYIEGSKIAEIMPDLQAGLATYALLNDKKTEENVKEEYQVADKGNYNQESYQFMQQQNAVKFQVAKNAKEMEQIETFQKVNDIAGQFADTYSKFAQDYPLLNSALVAATDAVMAFGAALTALDLLNFLTGKNNPKGFGQLAKTFFTAGGASAVASNATAAVTTTTTGVASTSLATIAGTGLVVFGAAKGRTAHAARAEAESEKRDEMIKQFHLNNQSKKPAMFRYGGDPMVLNNTTPN